MQVLFYLCFKMSPKKQKKKQVKESKNLSCEAAQRRTTSCTEKHIKTACEFKAFPIIF